MAARDGIRPYIRSAGHELEQHEHRGHRRQPTLHREQRREPEVDDRAMGRVVHAAVDAERQGDGTAGECTADERARADRSVAGSSTTHRRRKRRCEES